MKQFDEPDHSMTILFFHPILQVYVFSGDSVFSPLVAALSGVLNPKELPEIEIRNSNVFLYFYTDTAYNMSGECFISYLLVHSSDRT